MTIQVTQAHIWRGKMKFGNGCPIALALKEQTGKDWFVTTLDAELMESAQGNGVGLLIPLPDVAQTFARTFDTDGHLAVVPMAFEFGWNVKSQLRLEGVN
jgi:hypothetical protein